MAAGNNYPTARPTTNNFPAIRQMLTAPDMMKVIKERIGEKAGAFTSSVLDLIGSDNKLMQCDPRLVVKEALKAAALDLPVSKTLGFAYVIPYKNKQGELIPQFQLGYKGFIQLAIRSGQFRHLNAGIVYEGEHIIVDRIKGTLTIEGEKTSDKAIAYFAYMQLLNGFEKAIGWSHERVIAHAKKFSKSFSFKDSVWQSDPDAMAVKTMLLQLKNFMPMSIEMQQAMIHDSDGEASFDANVAHEIGQNANQDIIDIDVSSALSEPTPEEMAEIHAREMAEASGDSEADPGF